MMDWLRRFFGRVEGVASRMFWAGLAARLLYMTLAHTYRLRVYDDHFEFGWEAGRIARALATGYGFADPFNGHTGPSAWTPPLYPLLLAGVFKLFGIYSLASGWVILAIDCVFSAATAPLVYEIGWRCFGRIQNNIQPGVQRGVQIALWSGWLWALYPAAMQYAVKWVWDMSISTFLFTLLLVIALRTRGIGADPADSTQTPGRWAALGLVGGAIALSNSSLLIFLPPCVLWMLWPERAKFGRACVHATLATVVCLAVMTPWIVRNEVTLHAFVPLRSNLGAELYESLKPENGAFPWGSAVPLAVTAPQYKRYKALGEVAYCKDQGVRAKALLKANPGRFVRMSLLRLDFFWFGVAHPTDKSLTGEVLRELNYSFLSVAGLLGLALAIARKVPGAWLFFWAFALVPLIYYFITVQARFRHPLEPLICVLSVYLFRSAESRTESRTEFSA